VHRKYHSRLAQINELKNYTNWEFHIRSSNNMKFFFSASPPAGRFPWNWPFIGIRFFTDNSTHIKGRTYVKKEDVYPLVLRPIATLWLPAPRTIHKFFSLLTKYYYSNLPIDAKCYMQRYSHRDERVKYKQKSVNCKQLHNVYPYIRRLCHNDYCHEHFMLNDETTLYILKMIKDK
jgi:hypothetical protein